MNTARRPAPAASGDAGPCAPASTATPPSGAAPPESRQTRTNSPHSLESDALFGAHDVVLIRHAGEIYRLQRTRLGKLILTK